MARSIRMAALACLALAPLFAGCDDRDKPEPPVIPGTPVATNQRLTGATLTRAALPPGGELEVARFSDETALAPTPATLMPLVTRIRQSPGGEPILVLTAGTEVVELARARDHYLVELSDPGNRARRITGWVYKDALESWGPPDELTSTGAVTNACAKGDLHVQSDHDFCAKPCHEDGDCQGSGVCDGDARIVGPARSEHARYCVATGELIAH